MKTLPILNQQKPEKPIHDPDGRLDVVDIWKTIQGEGPLVGMPAVFIRLAGCNLRCPACDTDYTSKRRLSSVQDIIYEINQCSEGAIVLVVLTGGEPLRQNIKPLVEWLLDGPYSVQIETNGMYWPFGSKYWNHDNFYLVCSPKTSMLHDGVIDALQNPNAWLKYIIENGETDDADGLPSYSLGMENTRPARVSGVHPSDIFVQPQWSDSKAVYDANVEEAVKSCLKFGYRLSLQTHKIIGVP